MVNETGEICVSITTTEDLPIKPIALGESTDSQHNKMATACGWGNTKPNQIKDTKILKCVKLPLWNGKYDTDWNENTCKLKLQGTGKVVYDGDICAGGKKGEDTCAGDSGGPLFVKRGGKYRLIGFAAWGVGCAEKGMPAVYIGVDEHRKWIEKFLK